MAAARLSELIDDRSARRLLAIQVAEEAKHSQAFEMYAVRVGGTLACRRQHAQSLLDSLAGVADAMRLFALHTFLESFAMDEFSMLARAFERDPLGRIYRYVRLDEAKHVFMGLHFLARWCASMQCDERESLSEWCQENCIRISGMNDDAYRALAKVSGAEASDVRSLFISRFTRRCRQAFNVLIERSR